MEAKEKSLRFLTLEGKVIIPFFQRTYVWDRDNWEELLSELSLKTKNTNFLGAIILKQLPTQSGEPKRLEVIDGQQRLTTISVLLKSLYDTFSGDNKELAKKEIWPILFYKKDVFGGEEFRIEHSHVDSEAYKKVIQDSETLDLEKIDENSHKILRCYKFFYDKLSKLTEEERKNLLNKILNPENKMLVIIDLSENDDEQTIFDTLNTAGVRLTTAEIIKNALYKRAIELLRDKEKAIELYKNTWEKTFLKDQETIEYWGTERVTGRIKRENIEILLHCVGVIRGFYDPDKHTLSDLSKLYKEEIKQFESYEELKEFINEIIEYALIFRDKFLNFEVDTSLSFQENIIRVLHILHILEISTFHPFILYIFKKYQDNDQKINELLSKLEKFVVRNMLAKSEDIKNYNKLCKQFIDNTDNLDKKLKEIPFNMDVENGLQNLSNKNASLLLFWVELYRRHVRENYDIKDLKYDYSLEHIMPQKWEEYWNFNKVPHPKQGQLTNEELKQDRNNKVYWIGNMTLLRSKLNSSLRNYEFERKINGDGRKKGMRSYADLSITRDDIIQPFDNGDKIWNEEKIEKRTEKIKNEIKAIWG